MSEFPVSQKTFQKHAERLWGIEAKIKALPESPEKDALAADVADWHKDLATDFDALTDTNGNSPQPLSGGTDKEND